VKRMCPKHKGNAGFSLVEVVVAMTVFTIGVLGVVPMLAFNVKSNAAGKNFGIAVYLAQQRLEQIRSWPFWEDYDASAQRYGITMNNTDLFGEEQVQVGEYYQFFKIKSVVLRNGDDMNITFQSGGVYDEGRTEAGASSSLNTTNSSTTIEEDIKLVRVKVEWTDLFGFHEIERHMYLAKF